MMNFRGKGKDFTEEGNATPQFCPGLANATKIPNENNTEYITYGHDYLFRKDHANNQVKSNIALGKIMYEAHEKKPGKYLHIADKFKR